MNLLALLVFTYSLTFGADTGAFVAYTMDSIKIQPINPLYTDFSADIALGPVFVGGAIRCDFTPLAWNAYDPLQNTYTVRAGLRFDFGSDLQLEAGWSHDCYHPQAAYITARLLTGETIAVPRFEGSVDDFYVTIRGRISGR